MDLPTGEEETRKDIFTVHGEAIEEIRHIIESARQKIAFKATTLCRVLKKPPKIHQNLLQRLNRYFQSARDERTLIMTVSYGHGGIKAALYAEFTTENMQKVNHRNNNSFQCGASTMALMATSTSIQKHVKSGLYPCSRDNGLYLKTPE